MKTKMILVSLGLCTIVSGVASADSNGAGTKGHVTAYDASGGVLDVAACAPTKLAWDYAKAPCGQAFRDKVKEKLCADKGKGKHKWSYQISDGKKGKQTANCK
ncbi:MAG: hypothetical protein IT375_28045 [Polyangiaceae bacterium]|nr:hypothetical protein [Polyangiaceae bacterium]